MKTRILICINVNDTVALDPTNNALYALQTSKNYPASLTMKSTSIVFQKLVKKYNILPTRLYRIQNDLPTALRDYDSQMAKGRSGFDLKVCKQSGLVLPTKGNTWVAPNGASMRPASEKMVEILNRWKGDPIVFRLNEGMELPDDLVMVREFGDHYSLQAAVPMTLEELNTKITKILETATRQSKAQFLEEYFDFDDQDN